MHVCAGKTSSIYMIVHVYILIALFCQKHSHYSHCHFILNFTSNNIKMTRPIICVILMVVFVLGLLYTKSI